MTAFHFVLGSRRQDTDTDLRHAAGWKRGPREQGYPTWLNPEGERVLFLYEPEQLCGHRPPTKVYVVSCAVSLPLREQERMFEMIKARGLEVVQVIDEAPI